MVLVPLKTGDSTKRLGTASAPDYPQGSTFPPCMGSASSRLLRTSCPRYMGFPMPTRERTSTQLHTVAAHCTVKDSSAHRDTASGPGYPQGSTFPPCMGSASSHLLRTSCQRCMGFPMPTQERTSTQLYTAAVHCTFPGSSAHRDTAAAWQSLFGTLCHWGMVAWTLLPSRSSSQECTVGAPRCQQGRSTPRYMAVNCSTRSPQGTTCPVGRVTNNLVPEEQCNRAPTYSQPAQHCT